MTVALNHVTKRFGFVEAICDLTLSFPEHGISAIMGPSGCGKTTILQMLAGLTHPTSGKIQCSAKRIAYVFQEPRLLPWRTVLDNILLARPESSPQPTHTALDWLAKVGLADCAHRYPEELSGGMRQRVSIARALYCDSDLLLLDEPFQGLDSEIRSHILSMIRENRSERDYLTLLVTHDRTEALKLADSIFTFESAPASVYRAEDISR